MVFLYKMLQNSILFIKYMNFISIYLKKSSESMLTALIFCANIDTKWFNLTKRIILIEKFKKNH